MRLYTIWFHDSLCEFLPNFKLPLYQNLQSQKTAVSKIACRWPTIFSQYCQGHFLDPNLKFNFWLNILLVTTFTPQSFIEFFFPSIISHALCVHLKSLDIIFGWYFNVGDSLSRSSLYLQKCLFRVSKKIQKVNTVNTSVPATWFK